MTAATTPWGGASPGREAVAEAPASPEEAPAVVVRGLNRRFGRVEALRDIHLELAPNRIHGLVGRNGAGKTTLLSTLVGQVIPSSGSVEVLGGRSLENPAVLSRTVYVRDHQCYPDDMRVHHVLGIARRAYPRWDEGLARRLTEDFRLSPRARTKKLSTGQRTSLGIIVGLASRAELTIFDEPYSGLDPVARGVFYDRLLEDFAEHPRTVIISTHLVDEIADLLNDVILLDDGAVTLHESQERARDRAYRLAGPVHDVERLLERTGSTGRVSRRQSVGSMTMVVVAAPLDAEAEAAARELGLEVEPVSLQEVVAAMGTLSPLGSSPRDTGDAAQEGAQR
ncbi:ABC transporter ATP-binding protein [Rothia halotolerans]|uniref:ABC transporter ATP-binding protein n=1 Tax=Rothia halotolerans TaxID=405770 RepID=UPI00101C75A6|nr:ABC transporter ATP-binding protein [Rothia halotolerans]